MSVTKDGDTGRWMSQIRVTDWTGKTIHKKKRGFTTKKEALQWERDFISQSTGSLGMTFGDFISLYVKDMEHRLKPSTVASKKWLIDLKVTPFFKKIPLNEIKPIHVRQWQNSLTSYRDETIRRILLYLPGTGRMPLCRRDQLQELAQSVRNPAGRPPERDTGACGYFRPAHEARNHHQQK